MMIQEFERETGIYPTFDLYKFIEQAYYEFNGDKKAFCKAYKANKDGLAERIQRAYTEATDAENRKKEKTQSEQIADLEAKIKRLEAELEREHEWTAYEDEDNVRQADYEKLDADSTRRELTDDEAKDMIAEEFGFERSRIRIMHEVSKYEIDRHRRLRKVGTYERKALFDAWDWNYIRFDVIGNCLMSYEMSNGDLRLFSD